MSMQNADGRQVKGCKLVCPCITREHLTCAMKSGEMERPSHMTKTRPQSIRYAPWSLTAAIVRGTGGGRTILHRQRMSG